VGRTTLCRRGRQTQQPHDEQQYGTRSIHRIPFQPQSCNKNATRSRRFPRNAAASAVSRFQHPIYPLSVDPHLIGALRNLATDVQHLLRRIGVRMRSSSTLAPETGVSRSQGSAPQCITVRRSITSLVIPCILRSTAIRSRSPDVLVLLP